MRSASAWSCMLMAAGSCLAQGDLPALLASQPDLSTLLELVGLVDGLAATLSAASNITIVGPTNDAFAAVPRDTPEGQAIELRNDTIAVGALLANHVFRGAYAAKDITDLPIFAQTLLDDSYITAVQPFSNFTGGAYNGLVRNGEDVCILSGEQTISTVTQAVRSSHSLFHSDQKLIEVFHRTSNWATASRSTKSTASSPSAPRSSSSSTAPATSP